MQLTKQLEAEILKAYNTCWEGYLEGDLKLHASFLSKNFKIIGTSESEQFHNRKEWIDYCEKTIAQYAGVIRKKNCHIQLVPVNKEVMVVENSDLYVLINGQWNFYSKIRVTALLKRTKTGWKYVHQHGSLPNTKANEGEVLGTEQIKKENLELRDAIKRRTIELEQKNRELEIEAALERIRGRAMAMQNSDELNELIGAVFTELTKLDLVLTRCVILIYQGNEKGVRWWMANSEAPSMPMNFYVKYADMPFFNTYLKGWQNRSLKWQYILEGENKRKTDDFLFHETELARLPDFVVAGMRAPGRVYLNASFNNFGSLTLASLQALSDEHFDILLRFAKVFDLTYTRFNDLKQAEAQVREAKIESALEKLRSRSLAMHKSEELQEVVNTLFEKLNDLNIKMDSANIAIFKEGTRDFEYWVSSPYQQRVQAFHIPYADLVLTKELVAARESGTNFHGKTYSFEEKNEWFNYAFEHTEFKGLSEERKKMILAAKVVTISVAFAPHTGIQVTRYSDEPLSREQVEILKKFSKVFEQAYIRFLDLQKAEDQTREAQIEASLEKVRAKAMAMRNTQDLPDTIGVFYKELHSYSMTPIQCGVGLLNKDSQTAELFTWNATEKGQSLELVGNLKMEGHPVLENVYDNWINEKEYHPVLRGNEIKDYYKILRPQIAFPNYEDDIIQYGYFFFFKEGGVYAWMSKEMTENELNIYRRFTSVLSLTYKRHKDLQLAEAHALKAEQDLIVIKEARQKAEIALIELQATQKQLIQSEKMASLGELTAGIAHEIQNPLNFVNNFSEVNTELIDELQAEISRGNLAEIEALARDIKENEEKINYHGKRADAIVKSMLQHSRSNSNQRELTDINQLVDEYLRLSYHGLRAKNNSFNASIKSDFDSSIGQINIVPQDIGRVLLNLMTNAFYAVNEKAKRNIDQFEPTVSVATKQLDDKIIISVKDNGDGIPDKVLDKIFQPFFTTKPTGQGTGLGLSLSYDIVKGHGGEIKVETREGEGTEFLIHLPA